MGGTGRITQLSVPPQPFEPPSIYDWLENCLKGSTQSSFLTLGDIVDMPRMRYDIKNLTELSVRERYWRYLTPRTPKLVAIFTYIAEHPNLPVGIIQEMVDIELDNTLLESLPEGIGVQLRESIAACRSNPPTTWKGKALKLVGRDDLNLLLGGFQEKKELSKSQVVSQILTEPFHH